MDYVVVVWPYDIDISKITINSILSKNRECKVYVITNKSHFDCYSSFMTDNVILLDEDKIIKGLTKNKVESILVERINDSCRAGWYFQQFLKIAFAQICKTDNYIIWDADTVMVNKFEFIDEKDKMVLYVNHIREHRPYIKTIEKLLSADNFKLITEKSYIVEKMIIRKDIMIELINHIELQSEIKGDMFFEKILYAIDIQDLGGSGFSEFSTYVHYVSNNYPTVYIERKSSHYRYGKACFGMEPKQEELDWVSGSFDSISFEKWDVSMRKNLISDFIKKNRFLKFSIYTKPFMFKLRLKNKLKKILLGGVINV